MQIILLSQKGRRTIQFSLNRKQFIFIVFSCITVFGLAYTFGVSTGEQVRKKSDVSDVALDLSEQRQELDRLREKSRNTLDGIALRVGQMQAQLMRLNAVGEQLAKKAKLNAPEFNFDEQPAQGGADVQGVGNSFTQNQLLHDIQTLGEQLTLREKQLELLGLFSANKKLSKEFRPAGFPVEKGWLSSRYGYRADPFTGKRKFHYGVDVAGKSGTNVLAAASGVVTWAGKRSGYGLLVEIDHGSGYVTRYAHNKKTTVKVGDVVKQGNAIAKMGSTGHSTGPHVHFEVLKNGRKINPRKYLYSAR